MAETFQLLRAAEFDGRMNSRQRRCPIILTSAAPAHHEISSSATTDLKPSVEGLMGPLLRTSPSGCQSDDLVLVELLSDLDELSLDLLDASLAFLSAAAALLYEELR